MSTLFIKNVSLLSISMVFTTLLGSIPLEKEEINYVRFTAADGSLLEKKLFKQVKAPLQEERLITNPFSLLQAAKKALAHLTSEQGMKEYDYIIRNNYKTLANNKNFHVKELFTHRAQKTLEFIIATIEKDLTLKKPQRMLDPNFLNTHFDFLSWKPDVEKAQEKKVILPDKKQIRITKYAVFKDKGLPYKTKEHCCALYTFNKEQDADAIRFKYTKQQVIDGALERNHKAQIKPLVWLTRNGLEEALLQGTICVSIPGSKQKFFTVDKNNGIPYDQTIKEKKEQKRYWYFKEITDLENNNSQAYVITLGGLTLAGDIYNIGLGKLILLRYENPITQAKELRFGLLIDTGGAFVNNLYQLDLFAGIFTNRDELFAQTRELPQHAQAYVMLIKNK